MLKLNESLLSLSQKVRTDFLPSRGSRASSRIVSALDIGTTKICAIVGAQEEDGRIRVLGVGSHPSLGLKRGMVADFDLTIESIIRAVSQAEQMADVDIEDVVVGIAGGHMASLNCDVDVEIPNALRGVDPQDIERVLAKARLTPIPEGHEIIHCSPEEFFCDGLPVEKPVGRSCRKLRTNVHLVSAALTAAHNLANCVQMADLRVVDLMVESIASSISALDDNEKDLGALLVDIGGGTSDAIVYQDGRIRHSACIPIGGDDITTDIHKALRISRDDAENLKKAKGSAFASKIDPSELIEVNEVFEEQTTRVQRRFLAQVIQARCQEIIDMVWTDLERSQFPVGELGGIALTGGSSLMRHLPELTQRMTGLPVKVSSPQNIIGMSSLVDSPIYSTGIGLLAHGLKHPPNRKITETGLLRKVVNWFQNLVMWYD